jgi:hypothetical protein
MIVNEGLRISRTGILQRGLDEPYYTVNYDFVLVPAREEVRLLQPLLRQGTSLRRTGRRRRGSARFVLLHLNGGQANGTRLLSAESVAEMQRIMPRGGKRDFGLGWFRSHEAERRGPTFVEHLGGGAGFWNVMRIYPEESLGVVVMGNTTSYDHESICDAIVKVPWE